MKPNLFIVGAAKAGTTSMYLCLNQHPDILLSSVKELCYFSYPYLTFPQSGAGDRREGDFIRDLCDYEALFE